MMDEVFEEDRFGQFFSWHIVDDETAIKKVDKSVFKHRGSGIPAATWDFWEPVPLGTERVNLTLVFQNKKYPAYLKREARGRLRVFWFADFATKLKSACNYSPEEALFPSLIFKKKQNLSYSVEIADIDVVTINSPHISEFMTRFGSGSEGDRRVVTSEKIERNPKLRKACIQYHGTTCKCCGFNYGSVYGELGKGYIQVHHIVPLSHSPGKREVDPIKDLTPLCADCHVMLHRRRGELILVEDLQEIIRLHSEGTL